MLFRKVQTDHIIAIHSRMLVEIDTNCEFQFVIN